MPEETPMEVQSLLLPLLGLGLFPDLNQGSGWAQNLTLHFPSLLQQGLLLAEPRFSSTKADRSPLCCFSKSRSMNPAAQGTARLTGLTEGSAQRNTDPSARCRSTGKDLVWLTSGSRAPRSLGWGAEIWVERGGCRATFCQPKPRLVGSAPSTPAAASCPTDPPAEHPDMLPCREQ